MDIWAWVGDTKARLREGDIEQQRLARLMSELPSATVDDEHERVDTIVPEALALARRLGETWVELFIRHWNMQSRVLHRNLALPEELREAVDLLEFANRATTQKCPQSVCVTQDLACCYSKVDGPGYVAERLAVADETLARIDPTWPCFDCISAEYFSALMDDTRHADALAFLDRQQAKLAEQGIFEVGSNLVHNRAEVLIELGRADEAMRVLAGVRDPARLGESYAMHHRMIATKALIALGRADEALAQQPEFDAIVATASLYEDWVLGLRGLVRAGKHDNDAKLGHQLLTLQHNLERNGSRWDAADLATIAAELAIARGARTIAALHLADARRLRGLLRKPARLDARLATLDAELAALPEPSLPQPLDAAAVIDRLQGDDGEGLPAEQALDLITAARERLPDEPELRVHEARVLRLLGRPAAARARLEPVIDAALSGQGKLPDTLSSTLAEHAGALLEAHDHASFDALLERLGLAGDATQDSLATARVELRLLAHLHRLRAESLAERGDASAAERAFAALLERGLVGAWGRTRLAELARARGDWARALECLDQAVVELEPGSIDWQRMTAATVLGRWDVVRDSMRRLGLPDLDGEQAGASHPNTPIMADLGLVRCEFVEPDGAAQRYWTLRTSPCSGRVLEIAFPSAVQHLADEIVYDPTDLDAAEADDDDHTPCFRVAAILQPGGRRSFVVRGFDAGEAAFEAMADALREQGFALERITAPGRMGKDPRFDSGDGDEDEDDEDDDDEDDDDDDDAPKLPVVALLVALEQARGQDGLIALREALRAATKDWMLPLVSPELDAAVGDHEGAQAHGELLARMWR